MTDRLFVDGIEVSGERSTEGAFRMAAPASGQAEDALCMAAPAIMVACGNNARRAEADALAARPGAPPGDRAESGTLHPRGTGEGPALAREGKELRAE